MVYPRSDTLSICFCYVFVLCGVEYSKKIYNKRHAPTFFYKVTGRNALPLLKQLLPYLRTYKKERAKMILKNFLKLTPRNGKYSKKMLAKKKKFTRKFFRCFEIYIY